MGESIERSSYIGLKEILPEPSIKKFFKIDKMEIGTIGHLSENLNIKKKWLEETLAYPGNDKTFILDRKTFVGKLVVQPYYWGEPRLNNEYAVTGNEGNYHLYMKKGNEVVYIRIPDEAIKVPKDKESIKGGTKMALSELNDEIQSA